LGASRMTGWRRIRSTILLVPLALGACAMQGRDQQEISATCWTLTNLQPMSKSDALAYLKQAIPETLAKTQDDVGLEPGVVRDANNNVLQRTTFTRDVDEQHLFEIVHSWSLLGERTATRHVGMDVVASYKKLDKPVVTDKEAKSLYFKDVIAIEVGSGQIEGQQPGSYVVARSANGGFAASPLSDQPKAYAMASAIAALSPQIQQFLSVQPRPSSQSCSAANLRASGFWSGS
jgi:hypothetical protein